MQIRREEVRTGLLVLVSLGILTGVLLALNAPGVFRSEHTFRIYFDNAEGLNPGAPVYLAGRKIGQVTNLVSPVPLAERPKGYENDEALVQVEVNSSAQIFNKVQVHMLQTNLLGAPVIDFTNGDENSGLAPNNSYFVGIREKDFTAAIADAVQVIKDTVTPVAEQAQKTMQQLSDTAVNLQKLTAPGSDVDQAVVQFKKFGDNLVDISAKGNALQNSLLNIEVLTGSNGHLNRTLANADELTREVLEKGQIEQTLANLQDTTANLNNLIDSVKPRVDAITLNLQQATDTLKRQPWRLVWPTTKKYPSPSPRRREM